MNPRASSPQQQQSRPLSARGAPLPLADRVALYCRQTSAANNAGVMRNVAKPSAPEMLEFLTREGTAPTVYGNPSLVRVLLTDSDYDSVCREVLSLSDAIEWHSQQANAPDQPQSPSTSTSLEMMFHSAHVFSSEEMAAARQLAVERGLDDVLHKIAHHAEGVDDDTSHEAVRMAVPVSEGFDARDNEVSSQPVDQETDTLIAKSDQVSSAEGREAIEEEIECETAPRIPSQGLEDDAGEPAEEDERGSDAEHIEEEANRMDEERSHEDLVEEHVDAEAPQERESQVIVEDSAAQRAIDELTTVEQSTREETNSHLTERDEYSDSTHLVLGVEANNEDIQPSRATDDGDRSSSITKKAERGAATDGDEAPIKKEPNASPSPEILSPEPHAGPDIQPPEPVASDLFIVDERHSALLTHSASTVERIVRTLDKQIQGLESDEQDATIELAITHDATLLERRYSAIAEELEKAAEEAVSSLDDTEPKAISTSSAASTSDANPPEVETSNPRDATPATFEDSTVKSSVIPTETSAALPIVASTSTLESATPIEPPSVIPLPVFRVGDAVEARYRGWNRYFQGEIAVVVDDVAGVYEVRYADGDYEVDVPADFIRPLTHESLELVPVQQIALAPADTGACRYDIGDQIEALYRGRTRWYPGTISRVQFAASTRSATYDIVYDDGETEVGVVDHHVRLRSISTVNSSASSTGAALVESAATLIRTASMEADCTSLANILNIQPFSVGKEEGQFTAETERLWRIGDRVCVQQSSSPLVLVAWILDVSRTQKDAYDVLYDAGGGRHRAGEKECGVVANRIQRLETRPASEEPQEELHVHPDASVTEQGEGDERRPLRSNQSHESDLPEVTPVLPFHRSPEAEEIINHETKQAPSVPPIVLEAARLLAQVAGDAEEENESQLNVLSEQSEAEDSDSEEDLILQSSAQLKLPTPRSNQSVPPSADTAVRRTAKSTPMSIKKPIPKRKTQQPSHEQPHEPVLSEATLRYLTPQPRKTIERPRTGRSQASTTPRAGTSTPNKATKPKLKPPAAAVDVSWKELEEWENVDLILNRKRKIVNNGQVEGSEVPWGEEFAAIQSLKRFASQYPEVLRQHIDHQLQEVVNSSTATGGARPMTTSATAAARDALLLIKDLAFLLRHRLAPFLDTILPVVLPAVFHSQKRFLCDTAYQVLEALVAHCSSRKLVVALLKQGLRFPRDDMRLVNLTCLYVEKCLTSLSFAAVQELMTRSTAVVLEGVADLLSCKSAACQSSLQKSLLLIQQAIGEETMESVLEDHLVGNALAIVRKHLALAVSAACHGPNKSPQASPKKLQATPAKQAAVAAANAANAGGSMSILQRMLLQRQNRVMPAPK